MISSKGFLRKNLKRAKKNHNSKITMKIDENYSRKPKIFWRTLQSLCSMKKIISFKFKANDGIFIIIPDAILNHWENTLKSFSKLIKPPTFTNIDNVIKRGPASKLFSL